MHCLAFLLFESSPDTRLLLTILVAAACAFSLHRLRFLHRPYCALARNRALSYTLIFLISFVAVACLSLKRGLPLPYVHDEFSNLLAADTFAHGRLTNPPHALWQHFESMHILVRPSYMSKYPPAQGLFMALGQVTTGHPIVGVWLSAALAATAICYALYAFLPAPWALLGGLVATLHPQLLEWGQRFWGASIPTLAGAMLVGSAARLFPAITRSSFVVHHSSFLPAFVLAAAIVLLANSRPYEGLVFTILVGAAIVFSWVLRRSRAPRPASSALVSVQGDAQAGTGFRQGSGRAFLTVTLPLLCLAFLWMGYYNRRVTGNPFRLPYVEHQSQYGSFPLFIFQKAPPRKSYLHKELDHFLVHEQYYWYARRHSWYELAKEALRDLTRFKEGAFGNVEVLALPLLLLPWLLVRNRALRLLAVVLFLFVCALLLETYCFAHYASPAAILIAAIILLCLRRLSHLAPPLGPLLTRLTIGLFFLNAILWYKDFYNWKQEGFPLARHEILATLRNTPGSHLVIVRYNQHNVHEEWVYNDAEIDAAKVIWAREMDAESNRRLLDYYRSRRAWLLEPDATPPKLQEYPHGRN